MRSSRRFDRPSRYHTLSDCAKTQGRMCQLLELTPLLILHEVGSMPRRLITAVLCVAILPVWLPFCCAQPVPEYDPGGARRPKPDLSFRKAGQYKRVHQAALRFVLRGDVEKPDQFLTRYLEEHPNDEETLYMLGVLNVYRGDIEAGTDFLRRSVEAGLPPGRLIAGPRELLQPIRDSSFLKAIRRELRDRPVHGPLVGNTSATGVSIWVRTEDEAAVRVVVREAGTSGPLRTGAVARSSAVADYTAVASINGLKPNTQYAYSVPIGDGPLRFHESQTFRTFPAQGEASKFAIAFGGGAGFVPPNERMWNTIGSFNPNAMLLLGDNVYIDDPESVVMQQYTYQRRQSRPEWRALTARTPTFTIWDDHDFSTNDSWGGADVDIPFWKKDWVFPTFRQNWANPGYAGGDAQPGCWYSFSIGDVDFIMLDCRYYRTDPDGDELSMLGPVQMQWLKEQLRASAGKFVVLCSSVPWDFRTKGDSNDTWNGYRAEREEIFSFLEKRKQEGVILLSADRHRSDAWKIERENGYGLYEFSSSRLTNQHVHPRMEEAGAIFSYNELQSFGLVTFDTAQDDPTVKYEVISIDGDRPFDLEVRRSQLTYSERDTARRVQQPASGSMAASD